MITPTTIQRRTNEQERASLEAVTASKPHLVLVLSDLHLGKGRDPITGTFDLAENFFADDAFSRCLAAHAAPGALLILNGDSFDFHRVTNCPHTDQEYRDWAARMRQLGDVTHADLLDRLAALGVGGRKRSKEGVISKSEQRYGLQTDDFKSVWQLDRMLEGHQVFAKALADWVTSGGSLVVGSGNHDPEVYWPLVRQCIRDTLVSHGAAAQVVQERVVFSERPFTVGNVHVEHGNEYEEMTAIGDPVLASDPTQVRLALGSFMNRYFINRIERLDPFLDNVKPANGAIIAILKRRPLRALSWWLMGGRFIRRAIKMGQYRAAMAASLYLATLAVPLIVIALVVLNAIWPNVVAPLLAWLPNPQARAGGTLIGILMPVLAPYLLGAVMELKRILDRRKPDPLAVGAVEKLRRHFGAKPGRFYATMGHTHRPGVWKLPAASREEFYVNTGTWIPIWPEHRLDLVGRVVYTFLRLKLQPSGEYRHELLEWEDAATRAQPAVTLAEDSVSPSEWKVMVRQADGGQASGR